MLIGELLSAIACVELKLKGVFERTAGTVLILNADWALYVLFETD